MFMNQFLWLKEINGMNYQSFFQKNACGFLVCKNDKYSTIIEANDAFYEMVGYTKEEMLDKHKNRFSELVIDDLDEILEKVNATINHGAVLDYEYRIKHNSGKIMWIHDIATYVPEENIFNVAIMDITYKEKELESAFKAATLDKVTGLLNRATLEKRIKKRVGESSNTPQFMILLDLDNFKKVNDKNGHQSGDKVLEIVGEKLKQISKENYLIGRLGGDEFMVFCNSIKSAEEVHTYSQKIVDTLKLEVGGICISASLGVILDELGRCNFEELYSLGDTALYQVKYTNKGIYEMKVIERG